MKRSRPDIGRLDFDSLTSQAELRALFPRTKHDVNITLLVLADGLIEV
jgi:hypothetical protein